MCEFVRRSLGDIALSSLPMKTQLCLIYLTFNYVIPTSLLGATFVLYLLIPFRFFFSSLFFFLSVQSAYGMYAQTYPACVLSKPLSLRSFHFIIIIICRQLLDISFELYGLSRLCSLSNDTSFFSIINSEHGPKVLCEAW